MRHIRPAITLLTLVLQCAFAAAQAKDMTNVERDQVQLMLSQVSADLTHHYYDPTLHGIDWPAKVQLAHDQIKQEKSLNMAMAHVAAALDSLNDSHTFLIPPRRPYDLDHGWTTEMIGEKCFVTRVQLGGDADRHGVSPGDELLAINGYRLTRDNLWKIEFAFNVLRPLQQLTLTLSDPGGAQRKTMLDAKLVPRVHLQELDANTLQNIRIDQERWQNAQHIRTVEEGDDLLIAKLPSFLFDQIELGKLVSKARKRRALILDLRENHGGSIEMLIGMIGNLFDHDVKLYDRVSRDSTKPVVAKSTHHPFDGKLLVLIDSKTASASELLARIVQIEHRGTVIGDRSAGSVMEAKVYPYKAGADMVMFYGASITEANLLMPDGKSLEHLGVAPDEVVIAGAADLANGRDPALAHAAELAGVKMTPEKAGKLFPFEW